MNNLIVWPLSRSARPPPPSILPQYCGANCLEIVKIIIRSWPHQSHVCSYLSIRRLAAAATTLPPRYSRLSPQFSLNTTRRVQDKQTLAAADRGVAAASGWLLQLCVRSLEKEYQELSDARLHLYIQRASGSSSRYWWWHGDSVVNFKKRPLSRQQTASAATRATREQISNQWKGERGRRRRSKGCCLEFRGY